MPTPVDRHLVPDLGALSAACASVVEHAVPGQLLMLTSTTYVGTTRDLLVEPLTARGFVVGEDIFVAFSPERIDPGNARHTQDTTPRVVGGTGRETTDRAAAVLARTAPSVHVLPSPEAAEMTKLWENTFRAVNIALANEFAENCRTLGIDPIPVIEAAATKPYGFMPFYPGPGVGGHCIPCDPHYLLWQLRAERTASPVIEAAMTAIAGRPGMVVRRVRELLGERGLATVGARVLVVGIAYKPGVADLRESPALEIIEELAAADKPRCASPIRWCGPRGWAGCSRRAWPRPRTSRGTWCWCTPSTRVPTWRGSTDAWTSWTRPTGWPAVPAKAVL